MPLQVSLQERSIGRVHRDRTGEDNMNTDRGKDRSNATTKQGRLAATRSWKKQGQILPYGLKREYDPVNTLISAQ